MSRRKFSERDVILTLAFQGVYVTCFRCKKPFCEPSIDSANRIAIFMPLLPEREHLHEYKLGGADEPFNCRYSCKPCHAVITNGTKATTAGSSKQRIAKIKRITGVTKGPRKKAWAKGQKLQSRPFQKRPKT